MSNRIPVFNKYSLCGKYLLQWKCYFAWGVAGEADSATWFVSQFMTRKSI